MIARLAARCGGLTHLLLIVATVLLPPLLFAGGSVLAWGPALEAGQNRLTRAVDLAHENASRVLETYQLLLIQAAAMLDGLTDDEIVAGAPRLRAHWGTLLDGLPQAQELFVLDRDGHPLVSTRIAPTARDADLSQRDYFQAARAGGGQVVVSGLQSGRLGSGSYFNVAIARRDRSGAFLGVLAVSANPTYFEQFWVRSGIADETPAGMTIAMFRGDGGILARWPQPVRANAAARVSDDFAAQLAANPQSAAYRRRSLTDGIDRLLSYRQVEDMPIYLVGSLRVPAIEAQWRATMLTHLYFGLPASIGLFGLALVAARRSRREIEALARLREEASRREATEVVLRQSQKMEAVGRLTGGIAHDFNNTLTALGGSIEALARHVPAGDTRTQRYAALGREAVQRATTLTHRLLAFARQQPLDPRTIDLNALVAGMSDLLHRSLGEHIDIETVLGGGLWRTRTDPGQLENALLNLAVNARDAMPDGGKLTIETANTHLDALYAASNEEVTPGQYVMLAVTDTGTGMPPDIAARAFEPFFTTKPVGQGTGLGLSMIYGFAKQSGGHVKIYSEPGHGTTIKLYLPRIIAELEPVAAALEPPAAPPGAGETILVVEDNDAVRQFSIDSLLALGYRVIWAPDAEAALRHVQASPEIGLLFTDVVLPGGVNGRKLAEQVLRLRPGLPVLFTTGYTANAIIHSGMLDPGVHLLPKPFTAAALAAKLRALLNDAPRAA